MVRLLLRFALQQRLLFVALGLVLVGLGIYVFTNLRIEAYPDISDTQAVVISQYPGHAAEEVEQQVTVPIERALNNVPRVLGRRSRTIFGLSVVELTFADPTDDYFARQVVTESCASWTWLGRPAIAACSVMGQKPRASPRVSRLLEPADHDQSD